MSKRRLSPGRQPLPKRLHNDHSPTATHPTSRTSFDQLWDEIILVIFSYLSHRDLCRVQATSQNWSRLALDNQLWKKLYLGEYGRARLRGGRGFVGRHDGREIKPLPERAKTHPEASNDGRDWKWMFRISSNWRTGRCAVEQWKPWLTPSSTTPEVSAEHHTCVLLAGSLIIASSTTNGQPSLSLISPNQGKHILSCKTRRSNATTNINCIILDQSHPLNTHTIRLVAFLSTSEFLIFSIDHHHPTHSTLLSSYLPTIRMPRLTNIFHAAFHENLLVTLSHSFHVSIYDLSSGNIVHTQTLSSFSSYPPSSLVLTPLPPTHASPLLLPRPSASSSTSTYKLIITYAVPIYPAHWSVGATELIISSELSGMTVTSTRTVRAFDVPTGWLDVNKMAAMKAQWGRKVRQVADTQSDGKWVVLAPGEDSPGLNQEYTDENGGNVRADVADTERMSIHSSASMHSMTSLQLYRLSFPTSPISAATSPSSTSQPKLTFVRMLHGHIGPVSALSIADGRCVSLGVNGSIWVWDLEGGENASIGKEAYQSGSEESVEVRKADQDEREEQEEDIGVLVVAKGAVVFDERRIVSAGRNGVEVRRFDV
ncbi:hypothetical protein BDY19DRAFT_882347 [Irpex rosettiformis]|uniref:Uncharacterized protein n=1 Tax=Irpex rosettiformis TaxID=378272 RepID=A0ACB8UG83_9APHY|nr:hypothetical protein BDY19DRAFT_882347 [Irpex rosettiformis]